VIDETEEDEEETGYEPVEDDADEIEIIDQQGSDVADQLPFYTITSYGADYPVDGLVRRISDGSVFIPTFQRNYVWGINQASRFIESLLLGLPVPGIFLSREQGTGKMLVIDGQQRLRTIQYFYDGVFPPTDKGFSLKKVHATFLGQTYRTLPDDVRRQLDDSIIHATVVQQERPTDDDSSVYQIFERLNTGGARLSPQEIRTCIYHGEMAELLRTLNQTPTWRDIYGPISSRMRDQEMILRFLALYFVQPYTQYMVGFLNAYMGMNRALKVQPAEAITDAFVPAINLVHGAIGRQAFRPRRSFNAAVFDSVMVGVARRLAAGPVTDLPGLAARYATLLQVRDFTDATETGTAQTNNVETRLNLATGAFADAP